MKPVMQTKFGDEGNCFNASLASILELDLDQIPNYDGRTDSGWWRKYNIWLTKEFGLSMVHLSAKGCKSWFIDECNTFCLCSGKSARGLEHSCVGIGGKIVHDPHPSDAGLLEIKDVILFVANKPWESKT